MNLLVVGAAEGQDVDEKMGRGVARERSGLLKWCGSLAKPHKRSHQPTRERTCRSATSVPTASRAERPTQLTRSQRERRANRRWCRSTTSSLRRRTLRSAQKGRHGWAGVNHLRGNFLVAAAQSSKGVIACLAAFLMFPLAAGGLGSGTVVLRGDQERRASRRCLTRSRQGGPKPWWKEQRWNRASRWRRACES